MSGQGPVRPPQAGERESRKFHMAKSGKRRRFWQQYGNLILTLSGI